MAENTPEQTTKPEGCTCDYPRIRFRNGSGHALTCPIHQKYLERKGYKKQSDKAT